MTDFILYIHGVNARDPHYYAPLDQLIRQDWPGQTAQNPLTIPVYWGDLNVDAESKLLGLWQQSDVWNKLWFPDVRSTFIRQFVGDAAQYISQAVGSKVVERIYDTALPYLSKATINDRLHLVTHSWGTVILLDILFASRWTEPGAPNADLVATIRNFLFGIGANSTQGVKLASITTMGSPISIFSLMDTDLQHKGPSSHDITDTMTSLLQTLQNDRNAALPWRNFIHPGDAVAYPIAPMIAFMLGASRDSADVTDILIHPDSPLLDAAGAIFGHAMWSIADTGQAHSSYWTNAKVAQGIAALISGSVPALQPTP